MDHTLSLEDCFDLAGAMQDERRSSTPRLCRIESDTIPTDLFKVQSRIKSTLDEIKVLQVLRKNLNVKAIYRVENARCDGLIVTNKNELIWVEIKSSLSWASTGSASFAMQAGQQIFSAIQVVDTLGDEVDDEVGDLIKKWSGVPSYLIVYNRLGGDWKNKGLRQFGKHAAEVNKHFRLGCIRIEETDAGIMLTYGGGGQI